MTWRHRIDIDLVALRHNMKIVRELAEHQDVIAVVKADAYGLGIERCAPIYDEMGVTVLAVAALSEALQIRALLPDQRILLLGSLLPHEYESFIDAQLEIWVSSIDEVKSLITLANQHEQSVAVHLAIDTGMGRNGCLPEQAESIINAIIENDALRLAGICTHYPQAYDHVFSAEQEKIFDALVESFDDRLPIDCLIHRANSEGLLYRPAGPCNAVRVGLLLTGHNPTDRELDLIPVLSWSSAITLIKDLPSKHGVSYNHIHSLKRTSQVAVVPVGYADGLPIQLSNVGRVLINGHSCPILGQVTMDYIMVDVTDLEQHVAVGDQVILLGEQDGKYISIFDIAKAAQTIPYDILCGLRGRGVWHYHDMPHAAKDSDKTAH